MEKHVREIIEKIESLLPIMQIITHKTKENGEKEETKTYQTFAKYFGLKDDSDRYYDFKKSEEAREEFRKPLISQLVLDTKSIMRKNSEEGFIGNKETEKYNKEYETSNTYDEKYSWCKAVLLRLNILSDAKIVNCVIIRDESNIPMGTKKLSDTNIDTAIQKINKQAKSDKYSEK